MLNTQQACLLGVVDDCRLTSPIMDTSDIAKGNDSTWKLHAWFEAQQNRLVGVCLPTHGLLLDRLVRMLLSKARKGPVENVLGSLSSRQPLIHPHGRLGPCRKADACWVLHDEDKHCQSSEANLVQLTVSNPS